MERKVPAEVQKVFDKYTVNFVRRLNKDKAVEMFNKEFQLNPERAAFMFEMFDKDRSGVLKAWQFYLFYTSFGYDCNCYLDKCDQLMVKGTDTLDVSGLWDFLKELKTMGGRQYEDEELETCIKAQAGPERCIDKRKFIELVSRIKLTRH